MLGGQCQDPLLRHGALDIVILQDHVLLEDLDGVHLFGTLQFGEHHLAETSFAQHFDEVEVVQADLLTFGSVTPLDQRLEHRLALARS